jgi:hypothetical protein
LYLREWLENENSLSTCALDPYLVSGDTAMSTVMDATTGYASHGFRGAPPTSRSSPHPLWQFATALEIFHPFVGMNLHITCKRLNPST